MCDRNYKIQLKMFKKLLPPTSVTMVLLIITIYVIYRYLTRHHNYWKSRGVPYETPSFLAGNLWDVFAGKRQIGKHLGYLYAKYDTPYFGIYILGAPYLVLRDPEIIKTITIRDFNNFEDRTFACDKKADATSANSLFILRNPEWRSIRNKLTSIFTSGKLKLMFPLMKTTAREMQKYLERHDGEVVEIKEVAAKQMTDLVASCFFGFETNSFGETDSEFRVISRKMFDFDIYESFCLLSYFFAPKLVSWFKLKLFDTTFLQNVFLSTLEKREETNTKRNDFVDLLLSLKDTLNKTNEGTYFGTDTMVSQAITFFVAGFETTSNAVAFTLYELCLRQDCQNELRKEILQYFPNEEDITFEKIQQMKYMEMVLAETLRRYPFGPFLNRNCKQDYTIKETGLIIEKGTPVLIPIDGIHNDPEHYQEPGIFDPERFREGLKDKSNRCIYLPFGMGPRNCIGDRFALICAKVSLVYFLKKFKVEKCNETPVPLVFDAKSAFLVPVEGLPMIVRKLDV